MIVNIVITNLIYNKFRSFNKRGLRINGEYVSHLRFAEDIILITNSLQDFQVLINEVGWKMNFRNKENNVQQTGRRPRHTGKNG